MSRQDYPQTRTEFDAMFETEEACLRYLGDVLWPDGFKCSACGHDRYWITSRRYWMCSACRHQRSLTSGTLMQDARYPIRTWFQAAWHVCEQKNGLNALGLQRAMGFKKYETAWEMLHRLRRAMVFPGRSLLNGEVEVDEAFIGGVRKGKPGRGAAGKTLVLVCAEVRGSSIGRARLQVIPDATAATLLGEIQTLVEPGSNVVTDGLASYRGLGAIGYNHSVSKPTAVVGANLVPKAHRVISLLKRWLLGTHQGGVAHARLQSYLDEFVFRFNRRAAKSRGLLFRRLLEQVVANGPVRRAQL
jgi:transposase-like protein